MKPAGKRYLYAFFHGDERRENDQQVYFSISEDALRWKVVNDGNPVLRSSIGDCGVRDPFLVRTGNSFVLLATDLNTKHPRYADGDGIPDWRLMERAGSRAIIVWRSPDLVAWTGPERIDVAGGLPLGNVWAPKATYVAERMQYLVYWSSTCAADDYAKERIYACWTEDFAHYSPAYEFIDRQCSSIDAEVERDPLHGGWLLYVKNETDKTVGMYGADHLVDGDRAVFEQFRHIRQGALDGLHGVEGPSIVRRDDGSAVLYLDEYMGRRRGYFPMISDDPRVADSFVPVPEQGYAMPSGARHGSVLSITQGEFDRVVSADWR